MIKCCQQSFSKKYFNLKNAFAVVSCPYFTNGDETITCAFSLSSISFTTICILLSRCVIKQISSNTIQRSNTIQWVNLMNFCSVIKLYNVSLQQVKYIKVIHLDLPLHQKGKILLLLLACEHKIIVILPMAIVVKK